MESSMCDTYPIILPREILIPLLPQSVIPYPFSEINFDPIILSPRVILNVHEQSRSYSHLRVWSDPTVILRSEADPTVPFSIHPKSKCTKQLNRGKGKIRLECGHYQTSIFKNKMCNTLLLPFQMFYNPVCSKATAGKMIATSSSLFQSLHGNNLCSKFYIKYNLITFQNAFHENSLGKKATKKMISFQPLTTEQTKELQMLLSMFSSC